MFAQPHTGDSLSRFTNVRVYCHREVTMSKRLVAITPLRKTTEHCVCNTRFIFPSKIFTLITWNLLLKNSSNITTTLSQSFGVTVSVFWIEKLILFADDKILNIIENNVKSSSSDEILIPMKCLHHEPTLNCAYNRIENAMIDIFNLKTWHFKYLLTWDDNLHFCM